jgi:septum formation protein
MKIILASNSPRRRELLKGLDIDFEVKVIPGIKETHPADMEAKDIPEYEAMRKSDAYNVGSDELLITADTMVILNGEALGKPESDDDAKVMLMKLSGKTHHVVTGVCLTAAKNRRHFSVTTAVTFKKLSAEEIDYYIEKYHPTDKAGAYGIQEWIGFIGVTGISGSYFNVMGLPVQRIYEEIRALAGDSVLRFGPAE